MKFYTKALIIGWVLYLGGQLFFNYGECTRICERSYGWGCKGFKLFRSCYCFDEEASFIEKISSTPEKSQYNCSVLVDEVCGIDGNTYKSVTSAVKKGVDVLHNGDCGFCSNDIDVGLFHQFDKTLTKKAYSCAFNYLLIGRKSAEACMARTVGLTKNCTHCWLDNIGCVISNCMKPCFMDYVVLRNPQVYPNGELNDCLKCDDLHCCPHYLNCAGTTRRRSGVRSDIDWPEDHLYDRSHLP